MEKKNKLTLITTLVRLKKKNNREYAKYFFFSTLKSKLLIQIKINIKPSVRPSVKTSIVINNYGF